MMGIAKVHNAFCGLSKNESSFDLEFDSIDENLQIKKIYIISKESITRYNIYLILEIIENNRY
tara:strand:+ start:87 stop:275 length:189 start_codon:yes stop_codon:yes gene_type:complete